MIDRDGPANSETEGMLVFYPEVKTNGYDTG